MAAYNSQAGRQWCGLPRPSMTRLAPTGQTGQDANCAFYAMSVFEWDVALASWINIRRSDFDKLQPGWTARAGTAAATRDRMPPKTKKSKSSNPEVLRLDDGLLHPRRELLRTRPILARPRKAVRRCTQEPVKNPLYAPAKDEQARKKFFSSVDGICKTAPSTPEEYVLNS
jgi:hypothetical protein